ncbi:non-ribosomal peptide synthetase [Pseudonocardia acaciae]|uniref:non-ribosomal peptide synthetase n=1 Tax=Pseudonocardia acaciae TaxID=551276 RepID=UPI00068545B6|nr:non-ribosomal peptide synthetase [Pseudonocardia acaciae]
MCNDWFPLNEQQQAYLIGRGTAFPLGSVSTHGYYVFEGRLDLDRFRAAWRRVIERHDALRLVIDPVAMRQRVLPEVPELPIEVDDARGLGERERAALLDGRRERMSHEVRPPDAWPLFGVAVTLLDEDTSRVHISFDGLTLDYLSWKLLVADLTAYYDDADLPPLGYTFREYVLASDEGARPRSERYWADRVPVLPPPPALPHRTAPELVRRPSWSTRPFTVDPERWAVLAQRCAERSLTPTALVVTVFLETLARWADRRRLTVNLPRMNRQPRHADVDRVLGEFASFTLLAVEHEPGADLLTRVRATARQLLRDLQHGDVSGVELLRLLGGAGSTMMPVVFTSTIGFESGPDALLGQRLRPVYAISQTPQVYLDVQVEVDPRGALVGNWDFVTEVLRPELVDDMAEAFVSSLHALAEPDPSGWSAADVVPGGGSGLAGPPLGIPDALVQDGFLARAVADPDRVAVLAGDERIGYGRLRRYADRVACWLREAGVRPGEPVAVVLDKGWEQVAAAYGALFAGTPYVPIEAGQPAARVRSLLERVGARAVLTRSGLHEEPGGRPVLDVDQVRDGGARDDLADVHLPCPAGPDDLAYVLFTSGSTGEPKGVMIEHRGMVNCLRATAEEFALAPADRALALTAPHHDMSTFDLFGVLGAGGSVVIPDRDRARDPAHWAELLERHEVTLWNSVPAMTEMLLAHLGDDGAPLASLRLLLQGGDWIPVRLPGRLRELGCPAEFVSVGGPTETTLWNIWHRVRPDEPSTGSVPYGHPIANTRYHLLDERLRERPLWSVGEMYCAGPGVARGYWGDPRRTAERFVCHPRTGERLYRTGDLGRLLPGQVIEFVGRADSQVKVHGQRVEPGEIEAALRTHPAVADAVVTPLAREDGPGHDGLAGHVIATGQPPPDEELRAHLRERLPPHLVPARIRVLDRFPLTANGKVDRAALSAVADGPREVEPPDTTLERAVADVCRRTLGIDEIGRHDDFFALGGHSVLAMRAMAEIRDALLLPDLPMTALFAASTVATLAEAVAEAAGDRARLDRVAEVYLEVSGLSEDELAGRLESTVWGEARGQTG